jgi:holo-[acyl-carrier protein] synthase
MIYGIGVDIVDISRFRNIIERHGDKFAKRVLTSNEYIIYLKSNDKSTYLSKCWAVKEAFVKAMGTGFTGIFNKKDVAYGSSGDARPYIELSNAAELEVIKLNLKTNLSVSDEVSNVVAFVIVERTNY